MKITKIICSVLITLGAVNSYAQLLGLPVATDATPVQRGTFAGSAGLVLSDDINSYGGRFEFNVDESITVFGDLGIVDIDGFDAGFGIQGGGLYRFHDIADLPLDFGVRGTLGYATVSDTVDVDILSLSVMGLVSYSIDDMISVYGFLGISHARVEISINGFSFSDSDTEPAIGGGVMLSFNPQFSAYAELGIIDDTFIGIGGKFSF